MKKILLIAIICLSIIQLKAQDWLWSNHFTGTGENYPLQSVVDPSNNTYVYGRFDGDVTFDTLTFPME